MPKPLEHQMLTARILEVASSPSAGYAGRLFAESGAKVTKVCGADDISLYRDRKKNIVIADGERDGVKTVHSLLSQQWDIILWDSHVEPGIQMLIQGFLDGAASDTIGVFIQFSAGIFSDAEEYGLQKAAGWMELTGDPFKEPLMVGGSPATSIVGAHAACAGQFALLERIWSGRGRKIQIEALSIAVSALEGAFSDFAATGTIRTRPGNRHHALAPMAILPAADGWVFIGAPVDEKWELLERWAGLEAKTQWADSAGRLLNCMELERELAAWSAAMPGDELFNLGQMLRFPFAKVQTPEVTKQCPQLASRGFWEKANGKMYAGLPWKTESNNMVQGTKYKRSRSWNQLRIIDLTGMWSGPYCTRLYADMGVEVLKVESAVRPDGTRAEQGVSSPFFRELNRNKLGLQLDLRLDSDRAALLELVSQSDMLIENFSPRVMKNFGLDSEVLWQHNPHLIIGSLSAFGQTGPYRDYIGYGPTLECMSGLASLTYYEKGEPWLPGFAVSDIGAGIHGAFALALALLKREQDQCGFRVDVSQYETVCQFVNEENENRRFSRSFSSGTGGIESCFENYLNIYPGPTFGNQLPGMPWKSEGWQNPCNPPPHLGEHTDKIFSALCPARAKIHT
ncbi:CoA transferase [Bacillus testis]|uniref:CoA transferase n=1 Tax=Bacillus testis TaxID=1622072 RepID=UPI00067E947D|nr:CoA transferase [Bacillus testis]